MPVSLNIGEVTIPTDSGALKSFQADETLVFGLAAAWVELLDLTLATVPGNTPAAAVSYNGPAKTFTPAAGPVHFGLQAGTTGKLQIYSSGTLLDYSDGLDTPQQKSITVPAGTVYVGLQLAFTISANAGQAYSGGTYGVTSTIDVTKTYAVYFYKAFAPSTPIRAALREVFESYVLPLHRDTVFHLSSGDYLVHEFDGNLHLAFGAYAGLDQVLYAGQSSAEVIKACKAPLATFSVQGRPEIKAAANLDFALTYESHFEAVVSRSTASANLHLFRSSKSDSTTTLKTGLTVDANITASISSGVAQLQSSFVAAAGGADSLGGKALSAVLSKTGASDEIAKYVGEVNDKLTAWLNRGNGQQCNLQAAIEVQHARTLLAGYIFDLNSSAFASAWQAAYNGDLIGALKTGAVALDIGSGLEQEYQRKTSFHCNVFNLASLDSWDQFSSKMSLVYAGHNSFHLIATVGHAQQTSSIGAMHSLNLYFTVAANVRVDGTVSSDQINLHLDLVAQHDANVAGRLAEMLTSIQPGPATSALARNMRAVAMNSKQATVQLKIVVSPGAYGAIHADSYDGHGHALLSSNGYDAQNWQAFAQAADDLDVWPLKDSAIASQSVLSYLKSFAAWQKLNVAATGASTPDRTHVGNALSEWPEGFPDLNGGSRNLVVYSILAGQAFLNFCAALQDIADAANASNSETSWQSLLKWVDTAVKSESDVDFIRPAVLATIRLCRATPSISGPVDVATPKDSFSVTVML